ncbi:MAG: hypothetical protein ACSLFN_04385 [Candidatus Limnocylindrales bacterium]
MTSTRRGGLTVALTLLAVALAACGGGTATATPDPAATPTPAPTATAAAGEPTPTATPDGAIPTFDLSGLVNNLEGVDSYRIAITSNGTAVYSAIVVTKPVLSRDVTTDDGTRIVVIGDEAWIGRGDVLQPAPPEMATPMLAAFDPILLMGAFATPGAMNGATEIGTEEKNGVQARHFQVQADSMVGAIASMPPGSAIEMWVADAGYLVSLSVSGAGEGAFTMDVTDVNDASNVVERPS